MESYEEFIKKEDLCDFQQSREWAKVKEFWKNEIVIVEDENKSIIASMSILIRKLPIFGNIMKEVAKKYKAFVIIIEPNVKKENKEFSSLVKKLGYKINSKAIKFDQEIQARHNFRLNLEDKTEDEIFKNFASKTRYNVRLSGKKGVIVEEKNEEGIDEFYELMKETGKRDNFRTRPKEYFEKILKEFPYQTKIYIAYYENEPISAIMPIIYGNKMWYLYGASSNKHRNLMSTYLLQWEMIKLAIKNNCKVYDFRGVSIEKRRRRWTI